MAGLARLVARMRQIRNRTYFRWEQLMETGHVEDLE